MNKKPSPGRPDYLEPDDPFEDGPPAPPSDEPPDREAPPVVDDDGPPGGYELSSLPIADFIAHSPDHSYIYRPTGEEWTSTAVNARVMPIGGGGGKKAVAANIWLDRNDAVEQRAWAPGEPEIIKDKLVADGGFFEKRGARVFNLYKPPQITHRLAATSASGATISIRCGLTRPVICNNGSLTEHRGRARRSTMRLSLAATRVLAKTL